jgi:hypothetical protein
MKTMVIGWFHPSYNSNGIANGLEAIGDKVIRVAADLASPNERSGKFDVHAIQFFSRKSMDEAKLIFYNYRQLSVAKLVERYPVDRVLILQNRLEWHTWDCLCPVYYYYTETCEPSIPEGPIAGIIGGFVGAIEQLKNAHPYRVSTTKQSFIPYGYPIQLMPTEILPFYNRPTFVGFMGLLTFNDNSTDPSVKYVYQMRKEFLSAMQTWAEENHIEYMIRGHQSFEDYVYYMQRCKIAINIPGGLKNPTCNQRQIEVLGFGCVLLQWEYPELKELGYIDKNNCLTFSSIKELYQKLNWANDHPAELEQIRNNGIQFFKNSDYSWEGRGKLMAEFMDSSEVSPLLEFARETEVV